MIKSDVKDICTSMFITVLFTIAKIDKQPRCPLIDEWMGGEVVRVHDGIVLSHKK